jgi:hypothetical protein
VLDYMRTQVQQYTVNGEIDTSALAGDACVKFSLWDGDTTPAWLFEAADQVQTERMTRGYDSDTALFVEKPVKYEPDGDVLWA